MFFMKKDSLTSLNNLLNFLLMFAEYLIKVFLCTSATTLSRYLVFKACLPQHYLNILPVLFTDLGWRKISNSYWHCFSHLKIWKKEIGIFISRLKKIVRFKTQLCRTTTVWCGAVQTCQILATGFAKTLVHKFQNVLLFLCSTAN